MPQDLIVVVPWVLANVISGSPILFEPFLEVASFAAAYRNYHWGHVRQTRMDAGVDVPEGIRHIHGSPIRSSTDRERMEEGTSDARHAPG